MAKRDLTRSRWATPAPRPGAPIRTSPIARPAPLPPETIWRPQPRQSALLSCPLQDVFFGGARGGGKTDALLGDFAAHAGRYGEHAKGILFRRTYPEIEEVEFRAMQVYTPLGATYNQQKRTFTFPNGASLKLRYLLRKKDASNYQGHAYTWMGFDELGNWPSPEPIDLLWACLRSGVGVPCVRRSSGNPGGPGHLWVRDRYVQKHPDGMQPFEYQPQPKLRPDLKVEAVFIPSTLDDNVLLTRNDPAYENRIAAATHGSAALWKAWRHGDWWSVVGAAFEEWRSDIHIARWNVPDDWRWAAGMDWGYSSPGWFGLAAFGPENRVYLRSEVYFRKVTPRDAGLMIGMKLRSLYKEGCKLPEFIALDNACWATGDGQGGKRKTVAEHISEGLKAALGKRTPPLVKAPKGRESRVVRKLVLHDVLQFKETEENGTRVVRPWDMPKLQVHPDCEDFIRTVPALPVDEKEPDKVDTEAEDHPYDGFTYLLTKRTPKVRKPKTAPDPTDRAKTWEEMKREQAKETVPASARGERRWQRYRPETESWE